MRSGSWAVAESSISDWTQRPNQGNILRAERASVRLSAYEYGYSYCGPHVERA